MCWSAVNDAVMSGSLPSLEKSLTHGPQLAGLLSLELDLGFTASSFVLRTRTLTVSKGPVALQKHVLKG